MIIRVCLLYLIKIAHLDSEPDQFVLFSVTSLVTILDYSVYRLFSVTSLVTILDYSVYRLVFSLLVHSLRTIIDHKCH